MIPKDTQAWKDCSIDDIVEKLRNVRNLSGENWNGKPATTLIMGAGCSVEAGIPLANGIVKDNKAKYQTVFDKAQKEVGDGVMVGYPDFMKHLDNFERHDIHLNYIKIAKINWANLAIIELMRLGFIGRVITFNFDDLLIRAGAALGFIPAVYDIEQLTNYNSLYMTKPSIFYIHGQYSGFSKIYIQEQDELYKSPIFEVLKDSIMNSPTIVVGYSGQSDPVYNLIESIRCNRHLYWIGYSDNGPGRHLSSLLSKEYAFYLGNQGADLFFIEMSKKLGIFPPNAIAGPFAHFLEVFEDIKSLPQLAGGEPDYLSQVKDRLKKAYLEDASQSIGNVFSLEDMRAALFANDLDSLKKIASLPLLNDISQDLNSTYSWVFILLGVALADQAKTKSGVEADQLWSEAYDKYARALEIKSDMHEALSDWGDALADQAKTKSGEDADQLWSEAYDKYARALEIKPNKRVALYNWGNALDDQAKTKSEAEADRLWKEAYEKYARALEIKPDMHEALHNWGAALANQAKTKSGEDADRLWGEAYEKYARALEIKPDKHEAFYNWGNALADQAETKSEAEADQLWNEAYEKYARALEIKPDKRVALSNWGIALITQAQTKIGAERATLFAQARDILMRAYDRAPTESYNLACLEALTQHPEECQKYLENCLEHGTLPPRKHLETDSDLDSVRSLPWFQDILERAIHVVKLRKFGFFTQLERRR